MEPQIEKLTRKEKREIGRQERYEADTLVRIQNQRKKVTFWIFGIILTVIVTGTFFLISKAPARSKLPPIIMQGHVEENPKSHILTETMPEVVQKHMLEHSDGVGKPGIIIQYNCEKYSCESDIISKLTELVKKYPENVYLAPGNYDGKIILTKMGEYKILENYDEDIINSFIMNSKVAESEREKILVSPQEAKTIVRIDQVVLDKPGFVVIRGSDGKRLGQIIEMSQYLEPGEHKNISISLDDFYTYNQADELVAMIYYDNGDKLFSELDQPSTENVAIFVKTGKSTPLTVLQQQVVSDSMGMETVRYTNNGFQPAKLTVPVNTMVEFINQSDKEMWVASNMHPDHEILPTFDQFKSVGKGQSYMYTFDKKGTWGYHDHINPSIEGVVVVE